MPIESTSTPCELQSRKRKDSPSSSEENEHPNISAAICSPRPAKRPHLETTLDSSSTSSSPALLLTPCSLPASVLISSSPLPKRLTQSAHFQKPARCRNVVQEAEDEEESEDEDERTLRELEGEFIKPRHNDTEEALFSPNYIQKALNSDLTTTEALDIPMKHTRVLLVEESDEEESEEEQEELTTDTEEFDPYLFIAQLAPQEPVETVALPPKAPDAPKVTLVLDLDETLVHCGIEPIPNADLEFPVDYQGQSFKIYVRKRPRFLEFIAKVSKLFEVVVFTASQKIYADTLLDLLDPKHKFIQHRLFRESCVMIQSNYLKDLTCLGRDLSKVIIVDNSPQAFGLQLNNGVPIESWFDDEDDTELLKLLPFLEKLSAVDDVRPFIRDKFKLYQKVEAKRQQLLAFE